MLAHQLAFAGNLFGHFGKVRLRPGHPLGQRSHSFELFLEERLVHGSVTLLTHELANRVPDRGGP